MPFRVLFHTAGRILFADTQESSCQFFFFAFFRRNQGYRVKRCGEANGFVHNGENRGCQRVTCFGIAQLRQDDNITGRSLIYRNLFLSYQSKDFADFFLFLLIYIDNAVAFF